MEEQLIPKSRAWIVGLGLMYLWLFAILFFVRLGDGAALIGGGLASVSGIAVFLYVGGLERETNELAKSNALYKAEYERWKEQAQTAISLVKKV